MPEPILIATKLHPPAVRDQTIPREHLLEQLRRGSSRKLSLVACPAGFGKTTLLAEYCKAEAARKPVVWLTLDEGDNDPVVLWSHVIEGFRRVFSTVGHAVSPELVGAAPIAEVVLPRLVNELDEQGQVVLILDDFHRLSRGPAHDNVAWFIDHAPPTVQLVLSTRTEPSLRLPTLRARGELVELRADDLRFSFSEAEVFLNGHLALGLSREDVDGLVARTEGWPTGLYLAALTLEKAADRHAVVRRFGVSSRHVLDYLVTEVLEAHDPSMQTLMLRSSILERLSGRLCDAVIEEKDSAFKLEALSRTNLFLTPLDDESEWYRFHHLFAQLLRVELERREPDIIATLHRRAYAWHREFGTTDEAIHHAVEAGAFGEAAERLEASWVLYANSCRYATVLAWLRRFPDEVLNGNTRLLLVQAWALTLSGLRDEATTVIAEVERLGGLGEGPLSDGFSSAEASLTMLRAALPWGDVGSQLQNGLHAIELEGPESPWLPVALFAVGLGLYYSGESEEADRWFEETAAIAPASEQWIVAASSLAYRSLIAGEGARVEEQRLLGDDAAELARAHHVEEADGEVPVAQGMSLAARGRPEEGLPLIERGVDFLRVWGQPVELANALLCQVSVRHRLGERDRSLAVLSEARSIIESCADPGNLAERLTALERSLVARPGRERQGLTQAEVRVFRLLDSDLSEHDVGRQLVLSHNTVHSHLRSIYRKLGVSSRVDALKRGRELGLF